MKQFIKKAETFGYIVSPFDVPEFYPSEDFVNITYRFNQILVRFSSDSTLNLIHVNADSNNDFLTIWHQIGKKVGWALPYPKHEKNGGNFGNKI